MGEMQADTVQCDPNNGCQITVPAPGAALVFLTDDAFNAASPDPSDTKTFPTTFATATINTAFVDPSVLATSNGHKNLEGQEFTTSPGSRSGAERILPGGVALLGAALGALLLARRM
jgi:hypothetical protein